MNRIKKIGAVIVIIILNILLLGIIPLNVLLIWKDFPQWIMIIASAMVLAIVLFIAKKAFAGKASKIITVVLTSVFAAMCILLAYVCPYWNVMATSCLVARLDIMRIRILQGKKHLISWKRLWTA